MVDAGAMAQPVVPMVLEYQLFDPEVRLESIVEKNIEELSHVQWIRDSIKQLKRTNSTNLKLLSFVGGLPKDKSAAVPE